jgi:hypothetical protein
VDQISTYSDGRLCGVLVSCTNSRPADDVEALRGETVWVELREDEPGEGKD